MSANIQQLPAGVQRVEPVQPLGEAVQEVGKDASQDIQNAPGSTETTKPNPDEGTPAKTEPEKPQKKELQTRVLAIAAKKKAEILAKEKELATREARNTKFENAFKAAKTRPYYLPGTRWPNPRRSDRIPNLW